MTHVEVFKNLQSPKYPLFVNLQSLMGTARDLGLNYVFVNKDTLTSDLVDELKQAGYSVVIGQGEEARIKISW
jgi:uncharacterized membrane protein YwaF